MVKTNVTLGDLLRARMNPETPPVYKLVNELVSASNWTRNDVEKTTMLSAANFLLSQHAINKAQEIRLKEKGAQLGEANSKILHLENQIGFLKHKIETPPVDSLERQRIQQLELQVEELQADLQISDEENQRQAAQIKRMSQDIHTVILSDLKHRIVALENQLAGATKQIELAAEQRDIYKERSSRYYSLLCEIRDTVDNSNLT